MKPKRISAALVREVIREHAVICPLFPRDNHHPQYCYAGELVDSLARKIGRKRVLPKGVLSKKVGDHLDSVLNQMMRSGELKLHTLAVVPIDNRPLIGDVSFALTSP